MSKDAVVKNGAKAESEYEYGVKCTNADDGLCGKDCKYCHWSWPKGDDKKCLSLDAACRCKLPNKDYNINVRTFIRDC